MYLAVNALAPPLLYDRFRFGRDGSQPLLTGGGTAPVKPPRRGHGTWGLEPQSYWNISSLTPPRRPGVTLKAAPHPNTQQKFRVN